MTQLPLADTPPCWALAVWVAAGCGAAASAACAGAARAGPATKPATTGASSAALNLVIRMHSSCASVDEARTRLPARCGRHVVRGGPVRWHAVVRTCRVGAVVGRAGLGHRQPRGETRLGQVRRGSGWAVDVGAAVGEGEHAALVADVDDGERLAALVRSVDSSGDVHLMHAEPGRLHQFLQLLF